MIRKIKEEDLTNVMTLWVKSNFKSNYFIEKDYWLEIYNQTKLDFLENFKTYVYEREKDNEIEGFISIQNNEIKAICVKEEKRRKGVGTKLINYCKDLLQDGMELYINIFEKNMNGIIFFSNLQFKNAKIQLNDKFRETEYVMKWKKDKI